MLPVSPLAALGRRPLALFVGALAAGLLLRPPLGAPCVGLAAAALLALAAARVRRLCPWVLAAGFLAGVLRGSPPPQPAPGPPPAGLPRPVRVEGRVASAPRPGEHGESRFLIALEGGCVLLVWEQPSALLGRGDRVRAAGLARPTQGPGETTARWFLSTRGGELVLLARSGRPAAWVDRARQALRQRLEGSLEEPARGLALCLLLGEGERLDAWDVLRFRNTGTAHLLVVSGLHVALLAALFLRLLGRGGAPLALAAVGAYALLAGARPPALRAAAGFGLWVLAPRLGRSRDLACTLAAAALPLLLLAPEELHGPSFQISYAAVAALGYLGPDLEKLAAGLGLPRRWARGAGLSAAATLGTAPLLLAHFGSCSPFSLVLTPLFTPLLGLAIGSAGLALALPSLAGPVLGLLHQAQRALLVGVDALPGTPVFACLWPGPGALLAALGGGLALLLSRRALLRPLGPLVFCLPFFIGNAGDRGRTCARASLLAVGHGQCLVLELPGIGLVLHDAGTLGSTRSLKHSLDRVMRRWGRRAVDLLVVSHGDWDHVAALPLILGGYPVRRAIAPDHPAAEEVAARLASHGVRVALVPPGGQQARAGPGSRLLLLRPGMGRGTSNQESLVLHAAGPGFSLLSPGDLEGPPLGALIRMGSSLMAATLVAPHHGRAMGCEAEIVEAFRVDTVLVSRSGNSGPPPARGSYEAAGARVRWTAQEGDLERTGSDTGR